MADGIYTKALDAIGKKLIDLSAETIKAVLLTSAYTVDLAVDNALDDIPAGARVATATLTQTFSDGVFDGSDLTFPAVAGGQTVTQIVLYVDGSPESSARLLWHIDDAAHYTGLPLTTTGADVTIAWPNDTNKIFRIHN